MKIPYKNIDELSTAVNNGEVNTLKKAIRAKCLDCSCYLPSEVVECVVTTCPLHAFRLGKNPYRPKREISEEQRAAAKSRIMAYHEKRKQAKQ